jgi:hypothetical protein
VFGDRHIDVREKIHAVACHANEAAK